MEHPATAPQAEEPLDDDPPAAAAIEPQHVTAEEHPATVEVADEDIPLELLPATAVDDPPAAAAADVDEDAPAEQAEVEEEPPEDVAFCATELTVAGGDWVTAAPPPPPPEVPAAVATPLPGAVTEDAFGPVGGKFWHG